MRFKEWSRAALGIWAVLLFVLDWLARTDFVISQFSNNSLAEKVLHAVAMLPPWSAPATGLTGIVLIAWNVIAFQRYKSEPILGQSPLEIIFDPTNPNRRFWSLESMRDDAGNPIAGAYWEYRAVIKNNSSKTLRNVVVTVEATGPLPARPEHSIFDINKKKLIDLNPCVEALAVIRTWYNPIMVAGMAIGPDVYGPIKVTASADDVLPCSKLFHFDPMEVPMIYE